MIEKMEEDAKERSHEIKAKLESGNFVLIRAVHHRVRGEHGEILF